MSDVRLMTLDPGHFHAALVQKEMYPGVAPRVDVFVFDPDKVDVGTCKADRDVVLGVERFRAVPAGIAYTIVNGEVVVDHGERTGARPGQVVRPS